MKSASVSFIIILLFTVAAPAQRFTVKDHLSLPIPSSVTMAPDGSMALYILKTPDFTTSKWVSRLYLLNTSTGAASIAVNGRENVSQPAFSPDGKWVSFVSSREYYDAVEKEFTKDIPQIWLLPRSGGEAYNLTAVPNGVEEYAWSADGLTVALLSERYNAAIEEEKSQLVKTKNDEKVFPGSNPVKCVVFVDVATGSLSGPFDLDAGASALALSPAGDFAVYQSNITGEYDDEQKSDLYKVSRSGNITRLTSADGPESKPVISPDGKSVAYKTQTVPDIEFAESDLSVLTLSTGQSVNLTGKVNYSVNTFLWKSSSELLYTLNEKTNIPLYMVNLSTAVSSPVWTGTGSITEVSITRSGKIGYRLETPSALPEIWFDGTKLSTFSGALASFNFGPQEVVRTASRDGKFTIEGVLFKPAGFDPAKKYPLLVAIHGGPYGHFRNVCNQGYAVKVMNEEGFLVYAPNPRGSSGYTDDFGQANRYDLGGMDYEDVMAGVDALIAAGYVDSSKMGVIGGSYGGYLVNRIISLNSRFHAAVSMYGIYSFLTDWSNSWQPSFEKMYFGYYYWEKPIDGSNLYISRSPAFSSRRITTPTLILQGEKDLYTDIANSREMYQALKAIGTPVQFVVYPREGHGIRNEPAHYRNSMERGIAWFKKHLLGR